MSNEEIFFCSPISDRYLQRMKSFKTQGEFIDFIIKTVIDYTGYKSIDEIMIKNRETEKVYARYLCFYFLKIHARLSLVSIGDMLGGRDHTTVMHGLKSLTDMIETKDSVRNDVNNIKALMSSVVDINYLIPPARTIESRDRKPKSNQPKAKEIIRISHKPYKRPPAIYSNKTPYGITG